MGFVDGEWATLIDASAVRQGGIGALAVTSDGSVWASGGDLAYLVVGGELQPVNAMYEPTANPAAAQGVSLPIEAPDGAYWNGDMVPIAIPGERPELLGFEGAGALWASDGAIGVTLHFDGETWTAFDLGGVGAAAFTTDAAWFTVPQPTGLPGLMDGPSSEPGLYRFDGATWHQFTVADGLPGYALGDMAAAPDGSLWIAADAAGVVHFRPGPGNETGQVVEIDAVPLDTVP